MYLYLCSEVGSGYHSSNTGTDFIVTLPTSYYFSRNEKWELGLVDLYMEHPDSYTSLSQDVLQSMIHVHCDVIEPCVWNGSERKILFYTKLKNCMTDILYPSQVRYSALGQDRVSCIRLYIKKCDGSEVSLAGWTTRCTLHIQRV